MSSRKPVDQSETTRTEQPTKYENAGDLPKSEAPPVVDGVKMFHADFVSYLYQPHGEFYDTNVKKIEEVTAVPRETVAYFLFALNALYMVFGSWAEFLCNLIGLAYPGYVSVKAIRTEGTDDDTEWLIYWSVYATFSLIDYFASSIWSVFPFYWLAKMTFLMYLYLPQTKGSRVVYNSIVNPLVTAIDKFLEPKSIKLEAVKQE
ncbi:unnamed protein product [Caenorhabditis angaria]|uniref:Receptor expression-enhancing protein n=1 Tax=Caenorhabditis angaria TaxID=860376 RepID=A0A9P1IVS6_9PELO|nr:unnamed protein product [Caenorhabditis angaria]